MIPIIHSPLPSNVNPKYDFEDLCKCLQLIISNVPEHLVQKGTL